MAWYAAHEIEYFKYREGKQDSFKVWENIYLIEAEDVDEALEKVKKMTKERESDDKTLKMNDKPARSISAGIKKIIEVSHWDEDGVLRNGDEISWNEFNVFDEKDIQKILDGKYVNVEYIE